MDIIKKNMIKNRNLISKRTGIDDHFISDKYSKIKFPDAEEYIDIICGNGKLGKCIKNQYVDDQWIIDWINSETNKSLGKPNSFYVYNIDYNGYSKPSNSLTVNSELIDEEEFYNRANGVMYYDFDNIDQKTIDIIRNAFIKASKKHKIFQWFETSWSGEGCHIRIQIELKFKRKVEWMFLYMYYLHVLMIMIPKDIDTSSWYKKDTNIIDWSCASISRGFAIPYNKNEVLLNKDFCKTNTLLYDTPEDFNYLANNIINIWPEILKTKFLTKIGKKPQQQPKIIKTYGIKTVDPTNVEMQNGQTFDYNWRLKCVTTLMCIYEGDKDKVREACKYIYSFIKPYKNHTYDEMLNYELEKKIFQNGNMQLGIFHNIINDLTKYFGFEFENYYSTNNKIYLSDFHKNLFNT